MAYIISITSHDHITISKSAGVADLIVHNLPNQIPIAQICLWLEGALLP